MPGNFSINLERISDFSKLSHKQENETVLAVSRIKAWLWELRLVVKLEVVAPELLEGRL